MVKEPALDETKAKLEEALAAAEKARADAGHAPGVGRALSLVVTNLEQAGLWLDRAKALS